MWYRQYHLILDNLTGTVLVLFNFYGCNHMQLSTVIRVKVHKIKLLFLLSGNLRAHSNAILHSYLPKQTVS